MHVPLVPMLIYGWGSENCFYSMVMIWYVKRQVTLWSKYLILIIRLRYWHQFHTIVILKHCNKSVICIIVFHKTRKYFMSIHAPDISLSRTCPPYTIDGSVYSWFICKTVFLHWCPFMYFKCNVHVNAYNMRPVISMFSLCYLIIHSKSH